MEWEIKNELRNYPLVDSANGKSDTLTVLPQNILVDLCLAFPTAYGDYAYVSAVCVATHVVSIIFTSDTGTLLASLTLQDPTPYQRYEVLARSDGVTGAVVFGSGLATPTTRNWRFSTPGNTHLIETLARTYVGSPLSSIDRSGGSAQLSGIVSLAGADRSVSLTTKTRIVNGSEKECLSIGLDLSGGSRNALSQFLGPCGGNSNNQICKYPPIVSINGVAPDEDGDIRVNFGNNIVVFDLAAGGIQLNYGVGLSDVCPQDNRLPNNLGGLPDEGIDECASSESLEPALVIPADLGSGPGKVQYAVFARLHYLTSGLCVLNAKPYDITWEVLPYDTPVGVCVWGATATKLVFCSGPYDTEEAYTRNCIWGIQEL